MNARSTEYHQFTREQHHHLYTTLLNSVRRRDRFVMRECHFSGPVHHQPLHGMGGAQGGAQAVSKRRARRHPLVRYRVVTVAEALGVRDVHVVHAVLRDEGKGGVSGHG